MGGTRAREPEMRIRRSAGLPVLAALALILAGCWLGADYAKSPATTAATLETTLPPLTALQVKVWRNADWCHYFLYARGEFSKTDEPGTCNLSGTQPSHARPFDVQAQRDFDAITATLHAALPDIQIVTADYDADGKITSAGFALPCASCEGLGYVYEPNYVISGVDDPQILTVAINADWYYWQDHPSVPGSDLLRPPT